MIRGKSLFYSEPQRGCFKCYGMSDCIYAAIMCDLGYD
jgi:hypothetical protein